MDRSGGAAARMAYQAVAGGMHDVVAVCGVERMTHVERDVATRALATAADWELEGVCGESFLSLNATLMRAYMAKHGVACERFAPFAITAHRNALTNPNALLHKPLDLPTYLQSRIITDPIRLFDVSPVCNGASAVILASRHVAETLQPRSRVRIAGSAAATAPLALARRADPLDLTAVTSSTQRAMQQAGVDQLAVAIDVRSLEVLQQATTLAHHHEQAAPAVVILLMLAKVLGELVDPRREQRDLHGCAAAIGFVQLVLADDFVFVESHEAQPPRETSAGREARPTMSRDFEIV